MCFCIHCLSSKHTKWLDEFLSIKLNKWNSIYFVLNNMKNIFIYLNLWYIQKKTQRYKRYIIPQDSLFIFDYMFNATQRYLNISIYVYHFLIYIMQQKLLYFKLIPNNLLNMFPHLSRCSNPPIHFWGAGGKAKKKRKHFRNRD